MSVFSQYSEHAHLHWVVPIKFGRAEQPATCVVDKTTGMFVVGVDSVIWVEFAIYPFSNECLEFRGIVTSGAISPLPKLKKGYKHDKAQH
jgi:hypothetical protein